MDRRLAFWAIGTLLFGGCSTPALRSQSPEDLENAAANVRLVGEIAVPYGIDPIEVEAVGLVTGLHGTGSDPAPSPQRAALLEEMKTRSVRDPNKVLASTSTALVFVRGYLRPGIQKGDRFDIELRIPSRSMTTSLRNGWLMETRLKELTVHENQVFDGHLLGLGEGAILVDPVTDGSTGEVMQGRGRVLGGGVAFKTRPLGLVLKPKHQNVAKSALVGTALNRRFHTYRVDAGQGVATPKTDEFIELLVHPRYKDNIARYMQVVRSVPLRETEAERLARLELLERQLFDPVTAATAAVRLEAVGHSAIDTLLRGIEAGDPEVSFYSAEALAYLDDARAAPVLGRAARDEPAFRVFALTALSAMDAVEAHDVLVELLGVPSAETRYGAFRALWAMNSRDSTVRGEMLDDQFSYHTLDVPGPPMIHVTRNYRAEVVMFGDDQHLATPLAINAGNRIMVTAGPGDRIVVSRYGVGEKDRRLEVSTRVDDVIRAVVEMGGTYPDVVQMLQEAKTSRALAGRFAVDALPAAGRTYVRNAPAGESEPDIEAQPFVVTNPFPDLFPRIWSPDESTSNSEAADELASAADEADKPSRGLFGRIGLSRDK